MNKKLLLAFVFFVFFMPISFGQKIDVWDFGAEQLDPTQYDNKLDEATINSWFVGIAAGSRTDPPTITLPTGFSVGALSWVGGSNDRLRTLNTNLTRYDESLGDATGYTGRVYQNGTTTGRYMSLTVSKDDEVTVAMIQQNGVGTVHFQYVADPTLQDETNVVGTAVTVLKFVAKADGEYRIYSDGDKPSYYRILRKAAGSGVQLTTPTITNFNISDKVVGDQAFTLTAPISDSDGAFTYASSDANVATVNGNEVTIVGAGTVTITATQAATATYAEGSITATLTVTLAQPTLTNFAIANKVVGDQAFDLTAPTSNSDGAFSYASSDANVATVNGATVTIVGAGTATITATQAATAAYAEGSITATLTVTAAVSSAKVDVWDFGAEQLDASLYNNQVDEATINGWYPSTIVPGTRTSPTSNFPASFTAGVLSWVGNGSDRLRTTNTNLTRYDENVQNVTSYTGRVYCNGAPSNGTTVPTNRFMRIALDKDDVVTIIGRVDAAGGTLSFVDENDPTLQSESLEMTAVDATVTEAIFTAKSTSTFKIYSPTGKLSFFRILRKAAGSGVQLTTPTITNFSISDKVVGDQAFTLTAPISDSDGAFTYASSDANVATVNGNEVTIVGAGTVTITATQAATSTYAEGTITAQFNVAIPATNQNVGSVVYDFRGDAGAAMISAGLSTDGLLTLGGSYSQHNNSPASAYGLDMKVNATISLQVAGSCTIRFVGSKYSGLDVQGSSIADGDLGTQVGKVINDLADTFDFVYSGLPTTLVFKTIAATGNDLYLPIIEMIPAQLGKDFAAAEKNIIYDFDLRNSSIYASGAGNHVEAGLMVVDAGCCNGLGLNGTQHGITFKDGNTITLQVAGNSYIKVATDAYSAGAISVSSTTGAFNVTSQSNLGTTYSDGAPSWIEFLYVGAPGTVVLGHTGGGTTYLPYVQIEPIPYAVSLSSYVQKSGTVSLNGVDINLTSGATASDNAAITVSSGVVLKSLVDNGFVAIDLGGSDLSAITPTVSGGIASAVINGENLEITYADGANDPKNYTIKLYDNSYLHGKSTYSFTGADGAALIAAGQSTDGLLTLSGTYSQHNNDPGSAYGLDMKVNSKINLQITGSSAVSFLGSKYTGLKMEGTATTAGDLGTVDARVVTDLVDTYELVYSDPALKKSGSTISFQAIANTGNDIYLPKLDIIPAQMGAAYLNAVKNIPYFFDFRDGSIIPTVTNGQSGITKGLVEIVVGSSNAYGYNGTQHGSILKTGNQIKLQVAGNSYIKVGGSQYSGGTIAASSATGNFEIPTKPAGTAGNFGNDGDTVDFLYVGTAGVVTLDFTGTNYVPYIEVSPIPYDVNLTPWVQKAGTVTINGTVINYTAGADVSSNATVTVSAGTVISATNTNASISIDLGGNALSTFNPELTGDIASVAVNGDVLSLTFGTPDSDPKSYDITITDNSVAVQADPGATYTYKFYDGSELPQTGYATLRYDTFPTGDGIVTMNSNTADEAGKFGYHDAAHGGVFFPGNSFDIIVAGNAIVTYIVDTYGVATDAVLEFTDSGNNVLGSIAATNIGGADGFPVSFAYQGAAGKITATLKSVGFPTAEIYIHGMSIENAASIVSSNGKTDVWDFGAEQLDADLYNNKLDEAKINSWYDSAITPGTNGKVLPSFTEGVLSWVGGSNDRLRTANTNLTRYDENLGGATGYRGRVYQNGTTTGRYMSLTLSEDDEVTLAMLTQSGTGNIHFQYVADPAAQDDQVAVGSTVTELKFVAKAAGVYHIFDDKDKPSYFRIYRKDAIYKTVTGNVDLTQAAGIPNGYTIVFTNQAGKSWTTAPSGGSYSVDLPQDYTYELSLKDANGFVISSGTTLEVTAATTTADISILAVELYTVSGNITGLGTDVSKVSLQFTPVSTRVFMPQAIVNATNGTYSVSLEPSIGYTITAEGVNDYLITNNTLTIGTADQSTDLVFEKKPLHNITINAPGLDATQLGKLQLTFTNLNEPGYVYSFADVSSVGLRDGVYKIDYAGLDDYPVQLALTSNLTVAGADKTKDLAFDAVTNWSFDDKVIFNTDTSYKGLILSGLKNEVAKGHLTGGTGNTIQVPINPGEKMIVSYYYTADFTIEGEITAVTSSKSTSLIEHVEYVYPGDVAGFATIVMGAGQSTTYITNIEVVAAVDYSPIITVGVDKDYQTINEALAAISNMVRPNDERVTVVIDPGNYEEMIVVKSHNVTFKNASSMPSIALINKGVDIDANAVRITSYYGYGYNYYSQGSDNKWHADVLAVNKANGYQNYNNVSGTTNASYWNATAVIAANGFIAENIIFENSFNQYISQKEANDIVVATAQAPTGGTRPTDYGNVTVQDRGKGFVERAAAIAIPNNTDKVILNNCRVVGRQDSFYGGVGARVVVYKGAMMGAVDYIFGGMDAVFYKTDFVLNTSDSSSDAAYITAAQQSGGRGYLMYQCHVKSTIPGVETASINGSKPGYFGRPWLANSSEVVFFETTIDESTYPGSEGTSLISPVGWTSSLGGESTKMYEYGTIEIASGVNNSANRASWSTVLENPILTDDVEITTFNFTKGNDDWDPIPSLETITSLPNNTFSVKVNSATCNGLSNGSITVASNEQTMSYAVTINSNTYTLDGTAGYSKTIENLAVGVYNICFSTPSIPNYSQCFEVNVEEPEVIVISSFVSKIDKTVKLSLSGSETYNVSVNGVSHTVSGADYTAILKSGINKISVSTDLDCQGVYNETIFLSEEVQYYPNPTQGIVEVFVAGDDQEVNVKIFNFAGNKMMESYQSVASDRNIQLDLASFVDGVYLVQLQGETVSKTFKIVKK